MIAPACDLCGREYEPIPLHTGAYRPSCRCDEAQAVAECCDLQPGHTGICAFRGDEGDLAGAGEP